MTTREYLWMTYAQADAYRPEAERKKVSEVARSKGGFMGQYRQAKTAKNMRQRPVRGYKNQTWGDRRHNFIKRHMAQYTKHKTYRRWLALVMWAYRPPGPCPRDDA